MFIDPVGTGYSRVAEGEKVAEFHEYQRDLDAVGEFIRLYLARYGRWGSPKYLIGESYGTTRAAGLSLHLQDKHDIFLNGVMLVSLAVDLQTLSFDQRQRIAVSAVPSDLCGHRVVSQGAGARAAEEAAARSHQGSGGVRERRLQRGAAAGLAACRRASANASPAQLARFSGLVAGVRPALRPAAGAVPVLQGTAAAIAGQTVGRLDTRFLGHDRDDAGEHPEADPMLANLIGAYAAGINRLLKDTLKYEADAPYVVHAPIWDKWTWKDFANKYVNVGDSLRRAMHANPHMRVYVASGYYDLGTPHAAGDYTLSHLGLREHLRKNVQVSYFESGHMMYIHQPSLARMAAELKAFVAPAHKSQMSFCRWLTPGVAGRSTSARPGTWQKGEGPSGVCSALLQSLVWEGPTTAKSDLLAADVSFAGGLSCRRLPSGLRWRRRRSGRRGSRVPRPRG